MSQILWYAVMYHKSVVFISSQKLFCDAELTDLFFGSSDLAVWLLLHLVISTIALYSDVARTYTVGCVKQYGKIKKLLINKTSWYKLIYHPNKLEVPSLASWSMDGLLEWSH